MENVSLVLMNERWQIYAVVSHLVEAVKNNLNLIALLPDM